MPLIVPKNSVAFDGDARRDTSKVKTPTGLRRKLLVKRDTDEDHIQLAGANEINGLVGWLEDIVPKAPRTWENDADPIAEDPVILRSGKGKRVVGILAVGENVQRGDLLVSAANGRVKKAANLTVAAGATPVNSSAANGAIIAGSAPPGGMIVGEAAHDVNATGAEQDIVLFSEIP